MYKLQVILYLVVVSIAGCTGPQGPQGVPGEKGEPGKSFFDWFRVEVGDVNNDGVVDKLDVQSWLRVQDSLSLQPGADYWVESNSLETGRFRDWEGNGDTTAKFWTSEGDIILKDMRKNADGTVTAATGYGKFGNWYGNLKDLDGDGAVFKVSTRNPDGSFDFKLELGSTEVITGRLVRKE